MIIIKFISLIFAVWLTTVNVAKFSNGQSVSGWNFGIQSVSTATFIFLQFNLF